MWLDHLRQDVRSAVRGITRYPIAALVAVLSLAGGIGATTATLIVRDVVFRKPPALYRAPDQLSRLQVGSPDRPIMPVGNAVPAKLYALWRDANPDLAFAAATDRRVRDARTIDRADAVSVRSVTPEFFAVVGVDAAAGRTFSEPVRRVEGATPAVLSDRLWQTLFDGRADAIGESLWIDNQPYTVIGVMPRRFWFSSMDAPIWTPLDPGALATDVNLEVVVRRPAGVTSDRVAQQLQRGLTDYASRLPAADRQLRLRVSGIEGTPLGRSVALVLPWLLGGSVLLTLLIACANVAILVIAQWTAREQEIAIRASLGAGRSRIVRALLTESVLIAAAGGLLGIGVTFGLLRIIASNAGDDLSFFDLSIDPRIFVQAVMITLLTGLVSGVGPALLETRRLHGNPMQTISSSDRARQRWRHALVVMEIAVTVALLIVTGAMIDGYRRQLSIDMGFRTRTLLSMRVENEGGVPTARILDVVRRMPSVAAVAASNTVPYTAFGPLQNVTLDAAGSNPVRAEQGLVSPDFFATIDVPVRAGRAFTQQDSTATRTAMVNETLARRLFGAANPIGRQAWMGGTAYEIVGVVADYTNAAFQGHDWDPKLYLPFAESRTDLKRVPFLIRATNDPAAVARSLRREIRDGAPGSVVSSSYTIDQIIDVASRETLAGTAPLVPLIVTGMFLTAAGIYGVLAFAIARRSKELALRIAIGARERDLLWLVTSHSLRLVALGMVCGSGATFALTRVVRAAGGGGSMFDPNWPAFVIPVLIVAAIGALATWVPSRRALKINPAILLRTT